MIEWPREEVTHLLDVVDLFLVVSLLHSLPRIVKGDGVHLEHEAINRAVSLHVPFSFAEVADGRRLLRTV